MALILVQLASNTNRHAETDEAELATRINRGDVVRVLKDRSDVGIRQSKQAWIASGRTAESYPMSFVVVEITDMTDEEAADLVKPFPDPESPDCPVDADGVPIIQFVRRWCFEAAGIEADRQAELLENGELISTRALVNNAIIDKAAMLSVVSI